MEAKSDYPLADAVVKKLREYGVKPVELKDFESITGMGVKVSDLTDKTFFIGNAILMKKQNVLIPEAAAKCQYLAR